MTTVRIGSRRHKQEHSRDNIPIKLAPKTILLIIIRNLQNQSNSQSPKHPKTLSNFQQYRDTIKSKSTKLPKKHPCCIADGNELLRFHSTTFVCSLGLNSSSNLCNSIPNCSVCSIITNGFKLRNDAGKGILTTATSGKAHDSAAAAAEEDGGGGADRRAMLVCRVIAGTVRKNGEDGGGGGCGEVVEEYDSVAGAAGVYSNLDELYVFNPRAILPCFVVIYRGF
ncbi:hypothetical protein CsSME_00034902 [Camellia sinensis var. sinensis]